MASTEMDGLRKAAADLLQFYDAAGVDAALSEQPVDRFELSRLAADRRRAAAPAPSDAAPAGLPRQPPDPNIASAPPAAAVLAVPSEATIMAARQAAATAASLEELRATLAGFEGCNLRFTATNLVFADGNPDARIMFVGEAPGFDEDLQGLPFVGRSGQLLDRMLGAIGLDRTRVYIANVIPWRPPGNRDPTPIETEICRPFIERQIALVDPDILVTLGNSSTRQLFKVSTGITKLRGQWRTYDTGRRTIRAMATLHPAYLLRQPLLKKLAWRDLLALRKALDELELASFTLRSGTPDPSPDSAPDRRPSSPAP